ncbi:RNA polymerase sigma factor [Paraflavitalea speifideaquila]|uniref:RNA polymerase sigma factor n=1 Tax=Paraflavitalea speifideaquila TaxID=3076558 RepID=UPI0028E53D0F|nr:RNA polymerase sigma factor [Paraflavitalea speifideiaquila]
MHFANRSDEIRFLEQLRNGDQEAMYKLYEIGFIGVFDFAFKLTHDTQLAEDISSNSFIKLFVKKKPFETLPEAMRYLYTCALNEYNDNWRKVQKHNTYVHENIYLNPTDKNQLDFMIEAEFFHHLETFIDQLDPRRREVIRLYLNGNNTNEIAVKLNITEQTALNTKNTALKLIKKAFIRLPYWLFLFLIQFFRQ